MAFLYIGCMCESHFMNDHGHRDVQGDHDPDDQDDQDDPDDQDDQDDVQTSKHSRLPCAAALTCPDFVKSPLYLKFYMGSCCTQLYEHNFLGGLTAEWLLKRHPKNLEIQDGAEVSTYIHRHRNWQF